MIQQKISFSGIHLNILQAQNEKKQIQAVFFLFTKMIYSFNYSYFLKKEAHTLMLIPLWQQLK